jgi:hypothetical protein
MLYLGGNSTEGVCYYRISLGDFCGSFQDYTGNIKGAHAWDMSNDDFHHDFRASWINSVISEVQLYKASYLTVGLDELVKCLASLNRNSREYLFLKHRYNICIVKLQIYRLSPSYGNWHAIKGYGECKMENVSRLKKAIGVRPESSLASLLNKER